MNNKPLVIALEQHYWDAEVAKTFVGEARNPALLQRLDDLGARRIKEMDEAGIYVQVISHGAPSTQRLDAATAVPLAKRANDRLHEAVRAHPERFAGFAALPTADPKAAAAGRGIPVKKVIRPPLPRPYNIDCIAAFQDGDRIELEVEGLGRLRVKVRDALKRTWGRDTRLEHEQKGLQGRTPQLTGKYAKAQP